MMRLSPLPQPILFSASKPKETREEAIGRQALAYAQGKTILTFQTGPAETKTWNLHQALSWIQATLSEMPVPLTQLKKLLKEKLILPSNQVSRVIDLMGQNPSFFDPGESGMRAKRLAACYPKAFGDNFTNWKDVFELTDLGQTVAKTPAQDPDPQPLAKAAQSYHEQLAQKLPAETQLAQSITLASPKAEALGKKGTLTWRIHDQLGLMGQLLEKSKKFDDQTRPGLSVPDITKGLKALAKFTSADITKVLDESLKANNGAWVQETTIAKRPHYTLSPQGWLLAKNAPEPLFQTL